MLNLEILRIMGIMYFCDNRANLRMYYTHEKEDLYIYINLTFIEEYSCSGEYKNTFIIGTFT